jgi:hypothetical protein
MDDDLEEEHAPSDQPPKQLSFGETVKLITDFSQELRKQPFPTANPDLLRALLPLPLDQAIAPRIEQRRFLPEASPVMLSVKKIEGGMVTAEEQSRDTSRPARELKMREVTKSTMPRRFFFPPTIFVMRITDRI